VTANDAFWVIIAWLLTFCFGIFIGVMINERSYRRGREDEHELWLQARDLE